MSPHAAKIEALDPSGANGLHFHGRYRLIGPAALIDQRSRETSKLPPYSLSAEKCEPVVFVST